MSDRGGAGPTDQPETKPWPKPVRYTLLILLISLVGVGAVYLLYSRGILPIAGPFVAMFLGPLFVWLGLLWRRRRLVRRSRDLVPDLQRFEAQLDRERQLPATARSSAASDVALEQAAEIVRLSGQRLAWGQELTAAEALVELADRTGAQWQPGAPLTVELRRIADRARPLITLGRKDRDPGH